MSTGAQPVDAAEEHRRIDAALDVDLAQKAVAISACHTCGATPGNPCIMSGSGQVALHWPHERRIRDFAACGSAISQPSVALATASDTAEVTAEVARRGLQQAIKVQILAFCDQEITAKTLSRLQRFCSSMGQAMLGLEKPDALVRDRFGRSGLVTSGVYSTNMPPSTEEDESALANAPFAETYGANTSRGLIAEATKIGKELMEAQAKAQAEARKPSVTELVASLTLAKKQKLGKAVISALEKQIADTGKETR